MTEEKLETGNKLKDEIFVLNSRLNYLQKDIETAKEISDEPKPISQLYFEGPNILNFGKQQIFVNKTYILKRLKKIKKVMKERIKELETEFEKL